jgi:hypothetical protein
MGGMLVLTVMIMAFLSPLAEAPGNTTCNVFVNPIRFLQCCLAPWLCDLPLPPIEGLPPGAWHP